MSELMEDLMTAFFNNLNWATCLKLVEKYLPNLEKLKDKYSS
jgi:hypothetical protein